MTDETKDPKKEKTKQAKKDEPRRVGYREKLGNDKYLIKVFLGFDSSRRRKYHTEVFHGPSRLVDPRIHEIKRLYKEGKPLKPAPETLDAFDAFLDEWLSAKKNSVAESSFRVYENIVNLYIRPM